MRRPVRITCAGMFINALRNVWNSMRSTFSFCDLYFFRHRPRSGNESANQIFSVHASEVITM